MTCPHRLSREIWLRHTDQGLPWVQVEGVGLGALAAAAKHGSVDIGALVGGKWEAGKPVPFEFLADTFEAIAETSKRLDIVNLLVGGWVHAEGG